LLEYDHKGKKKGELASYEIITLCHYSFISS